MEEEASSRRSVAELAGKFKVSVPTHEGSKPETEKPVRRRPPRTLQIPKPNGDQQPAGVTSPLPAKAKRNSALIEKLQANLALSPTSLLPSPKSPGFRLFPSAFTPPSPNSAPVSMVTSPANQSPSSKSPTSPTNPAHVSTVTSSGSSPVVTSPFTEEERPASFETPPTATEGSILSHVNKARVRLSIRRRPPSRRHRKSSSGDEVANANANEVTSDVSSEVTSDVTSDVTDEVAKDDVNTNEVASAKEVEDESVKEPTDTATKTTAEEEDVFKADSTDAATCLNSKSHEEETQPEVGEEPKMEDASSSAENLEKDSTETTNTESKEEEEVKIEESTSQIIEKSDETSAPV